ncbi:MAG: hypothetical protein NVSMB38_32320 [Ktedonobacteraceae bacterium]
MRRNQQKHITFRVAETQEVRQATKKVMKDYAKALKKSRETARVSLFPQRT